LFASSRLILFLFASERDGDTRDSDVADRLGGNAEEVACGRASLDAALDSNARDRRDDAVASVGDELSFLPKPSPVESKTPATRLLALHLPPTTTVPIPASR
jgi:hypothetical protein